MLFLFISCINQTLYFQRIQLDIRIENSTEGELFFSAHHAWRGTGDLRYPASEFVRFQESDTEFTRILDVPTLDDAEGLLIYAWQDKDDDGVLCGLDAEEEYAGIAEVVDFPVFEASISIELEHPCAGAEILYADLDSN